MGLFSIFLTFLAADAPEGMVLVPAGPCTIGVDGANPDEGPSRRVILPAFWIDLTEVTVARYAEFVEAARHAPPPDWQGGRPDPRKLDLPVVNVSWFDASAFARWAGKRLPTEEEWEKAARGPDGRAFPWAGPWSPDRANLDLGDGKARIGPAGKIAAGASAYGALDLIGNVWEWTADPYAPYPGNPIPSIHAGEKYRVVRGGGAVDFYPPGNMPPRATARARAQPFGRHDGLGFRCVLDAEGPRRIAPDLKHPSERESPRLPAVESPVEVAARYREGIPVEISGAPADGRPGVATFGLPFPEGAVRDVGSLRAGDIPIQARALAMWRDGSIRWALVDVLADRARSRTVSVRWDRKTAAPPPPRAVRVEETGGAVRIDTGAAELLIRTGALPWLEARAGDARLSGIEDRTEWEVEAGRTETLLMEPPETVRVEDRGPLRARARVEGWLVDGEGKRTVRYRVRLDARAGEASFGLLHSFAHLSPRKVLGIRRYDLRFARPGHPGEEFLFGDCGRPALPIGEGRYPLRAPGEEADAPLRGPAGSRLEQPSAVAGRFTPRGGAPVEGTRAEGWIAAGRDGEVLVAVRHFWEQFPKALEAEPGGLTVSLWSGPGIFEADAGIAKSHEILLSLEAGGPARAPVLARFRAPLFGIAPADWYCAARSLGSLAPHDLSRHPQYETEVEAAGDLLAREAPHGMRHFGDYYYGGPYKGQNAYMDLEYDIPYNRFIQFARTGARKHLDAGIVEARHQGDIDFKHDGGPQWKHSPRHTTTEADLGHVFLRGLVASTWITGDPEGLENARLLGDWLVRVVASPGSQGNERQIGWSLYALTGIYEATWDPRYLDAMKSMVDRLLAGLDALGRFSIRWDNRISFFYGITLSGFVRYEEVTGDPRILPAVERIVRRLHGFYPEYAGRTLEGLAWLYARTGDPEVRLTCRCTWETTLTWKPFDLGGMTIFTTRFLPMVDALGLSCPREWAIPPTGPVEDGLLRTHVRAPRFTVALDAFDREPFDLVLLRHVGPSPADLRVADAAGREVAARRLPASGEPIRYERIRIEEGGPWKLEVRSETTRAWDIVTSRKTRRAFHVPDWRGIEALIPRARFVLEEEAREIALDLEGEKEGFKGAVVYDPRGNVAGLVEGFIDLGDTSTHAYSLRVAVPEGRAGGLWSLDLQAVSVKAARGIVPWVGTSPESFFLPIGR